MSEKTKYISITLGPIGRVIETAESTKELWAASYFFSYLAKKIIEPFKDRTFLLPLLKKEMFTETYSGAGIFPDRYIFKAEENDFDALKSHIDKCFDEVSNNISNCIAAEKDEVLTFLKSYIKVYYFEKEFEIENTKKVVRQCENSMNLIEMQDSFPIMIKDKQNYLLNYFRGINGKPVKQDGKIVGFKGTFLPKDAGLVEKEKMNMFESVLEISAKDLNIDILQKYLEKLDASKYEENSEKASLNAQDLILQDNDEVRPYHKYYAIVSSDGDSMGKCIEKLNDTKNLSQALLDFMTGKDGAVDMIKDYGGRVVYAGGDDLLFFAPIRNKTTSQTIYSLVATLDSKFKECLKSKFEDEDISENDYPTMSFGISITYYKYPLFEAKAMADNMLGQSKGWSESKRKNNLSVQFQKHSGQIFTSFLHKGCEESYKQFNSLVEKYVDNSTGDSKENNFLASVMHKLREMQPLFTIALQDEERKKLLKNVFDNYFNEKVHESYQGLFKDIQKLMLESHNEYKLVFDDLKECLPKTDTKTEIDSVEKLCIEIVYSALRFVQFVNKKKDE